MTPFDQSLFVVWRTIEGDRRIEGVYRTRHSAEWQKARDEKIGEVGIEITEEKGLSFPFFAISKLTDNKYDGDEIVTETELENRIKEVELLPEYPEDHQDWPRQYFISNTFYDEWFDWGHCQRHHMPYRYGIHDHEHITQWVVQAVRQGQFPKLFYKAGKYKRWMKVRRDARQMRKLQKARDELSPDAIRKLRRLRLRCGKWSIEAAFGRDILSDSYFPRHVVPVAEAFQEMTRLDQEMGLQ